MKIEVTELEGSLIQSLRDSRTTILVNGKYPVKGIYQNKNTITIESDIRDWHTGTPTEEGWYLCWVSYKKEIAPMVYKWKNGKFMLTDTWESDDDILMWQKIDPYKEKKE